MASPTNKYSRSLVLARDFDYYQVSTYLLVKCISEAKYM